MGAGRGLLFPCLKLSLADNADCTMIGTRGIRSCATPTAEGFAYARAAAWFIDQRAAVQCVVQLTSEVQLSGRAECGAPRARPTSIAATLVLPLASPFRRGVQRTLPLVAFLWAKAPPLPVAEKGGACALQPRHWRAVAKQAREWHCGKAATVSFREQERNGS